MSHHMISHRQNKSAGKNKAADFFTDFFFSLVGEVFSLKTHQFGCYTARLSKTIKKTISQSFRYKKSMEYNNNNVAISLQ